MKTQHTPPRGRLYLFCLFILYLAPIVGHAQSLEEIANRGTLRVGLAEFVPWTFTDSDGELAGFEVEVGRKLAMDMGVDIEFSILELDEIVDAVRAGEIDMIAAGLAITPARALRIEFSRPYFQSGATLVSNSRLQPSVSSLEDLDESGNVIVTVSNTYSAQFAEELFENAEILFVASEAEAEQALISDLADGGLTSIVDATLLAGRHPDAIDMPLAAPIRRSIAGFGVQPGNQSLLNFLNAWTYARTMDNWLTDRINYWFTGDDPLAASSAR